MSLKTRVSSYALRSLGFWAYFFFVSLVSLVPGGGASIGSWDKLAHFLLYGCFAILASGIARTLKSYLLLCLGILVYSGLMEVGQSFVPGRSMSAADLLANALGVFAGVILTRIAWLLAGRK